MTKDKHYITFEQKLEILEFIEECVAFGSPPADSCIERLRQHGILVEFDEFGFPQFSRYYSGPVEPGMRFRCVSTDLCVPNGSGKVFQVDSCSDGRVRGPFSCDEKWFRMSYAVEETDAG